MELLRSLNKRKNFFIFLLFGLVFVPFLIYGTRQGFYWDDWAQLLLHEKYGDSNFWTYFAYDRPLSAITHVLFFPILGKSPFVWRFFFTLLRFFCYYLIYRLFSYLFPDYQDICKTAVLLLAVCPLFSQYHISIAYSQHYTDFLFFLVSSLLLLKAIEETNKKRSILYFVFSVVCTILHLAITEYFAVLELLKLMMIAIIMRRKTVYSPQKFHTAFCIVILSFISFIAIRLTIRYWDPFFDGNNAEILPLIKDDFLGFVSLAYTNFISDMSVLLSDFWGRLFTIDRKYLFTLSGELMLILAAAFGAIVFFISKDRKDSYTYGLPFPVLFFGLAWVILGIAPFWIMGESFFASKDIAHADRCFLAAAPGFCLILSFILTALFTDKTRYALAAAALTVLFAINLFKTQQDAVYAAEKQTRFYTQIAARIPGFTDKTALVADEPIFPDEGNFATASALNLLYAPDEMALYDDLPVWIFGTYGKSYSADNHFSVRKRNYHTSTDRMIYIIPEPKYGNCVWILGPDDVDNPYLTDEQRTWAAASDLSLIDTSVSSPWDETIFGNPKESWCVLYQRARLLEQSGKKEELLELTKYVEEHYSLDKSESNSPIEWEVFLKNK